MVTTNLVAYQWLLVNSVADVWIDKFFVLCERNID